VVELYLTREVSYQELALQAGLTNPVTIAKWFNDFRSVGPEALRLQQKRQKKRLKAAKKGITPKEKVTVDTSAEYVKQLEDELLKLRIENAYLKELRRLRLEEEVLLRKKRESSTASAEEFKLKDILAAIGFPKATYMYWRKRFDRENPDKELVDKILAIRKANKILARDECLVN